MLLLDRLVAAYTTMPTGKAWLTCGLFFLIFAVSAGVVGITYNFFRFTAVVSRRLAGKLALTALVFPAIVEETVFRVCLVPHAKEVNSDQTYWTWFGVSLVSYILMHVLTAWITRKRLLRDWRFLLLATLLGNTCSAAYTRSGSICPPVIIHWVSVCVWLIWLGGHDAIEASRS